ncbi:glycosyltransferase [Flavobacterium sp.]|uniref:glycosyltransferase n=1 Tax=Flavobacterium sp. TaxID=239 RepID=UPI0039E50E8B
MKDKRIIQLIDSLEAGGAERMAVNYANALHREVGFSGLVVTRKQGPLREQLQPQVPYLFLDKKKTLDWKALWALRRFAVRHQANILHAHSTSFFLAVLLKCIYPKIRIIWHDHYGNSEFLEKREHKALKMASVFFAGEIAVNQKLLDWGKRHLRCQEVIYLPNFVLEDNLKDGRKETVLQGQEGKRILCLANLRPQKGHFFLLDIAQKLKQSHPDWTFHLVGKDFGDDYSKRLHAQVEADGLQQHVFIYGSRNDIAGILRQASIGILTSHSEGLPVSLLEYGLFKLPAVVTRVGEIPEIMDHSQGIIVGDGDLDAFVSGLQQMIDDKNVRENYANALHNLIYTTFVGDAVLGKYLNWLSRINANG